MKRAVIDQSGFKVIGIGLILSLFLGLIFKSQIRPSIVKARLQQAVMKLQNDVNIDFENVDVRLSEWGIPRPVIEIRGLRISPKADPNTPVCQENQIYIESLSFPLSFNLLFSSDKKISTVRVSLMELRTKNTRLCFAKKRSQQLAVNRLDDIQESFIKESNVRNKLSNNKNNSNLFEKDERRLFIENLNHLKKFKSHLNEIKIDRLRWIAIDRMSSSIDFNAFQIMFRYQQDLLNEIQIQSQVVAFRSPNKNYYLLKSDIKVNLQLSADQKNQVNSKDEGFDSDIQFLFNLDLNGFILDRPFHIKVKNDQKNQTLQFLGEFDAISLKSLNYMAHIENSSYEVLDFLSGSSVSAFMTGEYSILKKNYHFSFKDIKMLIGGGLAEIAEVYIFGQSDQKAKVKPFDIQLSNIDLTKILDHPSFKNLKPSIQSAGYLSGLIQFLNFQQIRIKSLIEKTSFVFSNKGKRLYQTFDSFNFYAQFDQRKIQLSFNDFVLDSEKIAGEFKYSHDQQSGDKNLLIDIKGQFLKPETAELFTGRLQAPVIKFYLTSDLNQSLSGQMNFANLSYYQLNLSKLNIKYDKNLKNNIEKLILKSDLASLDFIDNQTDQPFGFLFSNLFSKPNVMFQAVTLNLEKTKSTVLDFKLNASQKFSTNLVLDGQLNLDNDLFYATGRYRLEPFIIEGPLNNLTVQRNKP